MHQVNAVAGVGRAPPPAAFAVDLCLEVDLALGFGFDLLALTVVLERLLDDSQAPLTSSTSKAAGEGARPTQTIKHYRPE
jgi:hypothetical protein